MRINDEFEALEVTMVKLLRNGQPVVDDHGRHVLYKSLADAMRVANNWEKHRPPTYAELRAMSDEELIRRAYPE